MASSSVSLGEILLISVLTIMGTAIAIYLFKKCRKEAIATLRRELNTAVLSQSTTFVNLPSVQIRGFSLSHAARAFCWPKPDYGPMEVHRSDFMNGLRVAAAKPQGAELCAATIMFQVGSRHEIDKELGVTHFIRAASTASGCGYTSFMKSRYLQQQGGYITCSTDRQTISFTLRCPTPVFADLKCYLLDAGVRCCYAQHELDEFVKPMVHEDLTRRPPQEHVIDLVQNACWAGPLNNSVYCNEARVSGMTEKVLSKFTSSLFKTSRCSIGSVGAPFEETLKIAEHIDCGRTERPQELCMAGSFPRAGYETHDLGRGADTWIAVAVPGCGTSDLSCLLMHAIIAAACGTGNVESGQHAMDRIPQPPLGLLAGADVCTDYKAFNISYTDTGTFGIVAKTRANTAREVAFAAVEFLSKIGSLNYNQIEIGKRRLKLGLALHDDDCVKVSEGLALQVANDVRIDSSRNSLCMVDSIDSAEVAAVAGGLAAKCHLMAVAVVGDVEATPTDGELKCG